MTRAHLPAPLAARMAGLAEDPIERYARLAAERGAVDLAIGSSELAAPAEVKEAAVRAILADDNRYVDSRGAAPLRGAIAGSSGGRGWLADPETEVTVTCGVTEGVMATMLATAGPGDEVVLFDPGYAQHHSAALLCGATPRSVPLRWPDWRFDPDELAAAFGPRTRAIVVATPHNPTGRVFDRAELELIADLCRRWDALCVSDEIYEHIVFDGRAHVSPASLPGMRERTVVVGGMSKTYGVTGWRIGFVVAPPSLTRAIQTVHDFVTGGAPAPLQAAGVRALSLPAEHYRRLRSGYQDRRDLLCRGLERLGFECSVPEGGFFVLADGSALGRGDGAELTIHLIETAGVAVLPASAFSAIGSCGSLVRVCFARSEATLAEALARLGALDRVGI